MINITFSEADIGALRYGRCHHPDPRIQVRMEALYLSSQRVAARDIPRLCGISKASFQRDLKAYVTGGIEPLKHREPRRPRSALHRHRATLEAEFRQQPPATVAAAAARIEARTGIARKPTQVRQYLQAIGRKPRQVGMLPAKADVEAQETFTKKVWSLGEPKPRRANGSFFSWMPRMVCLPPSWGWSGASHGSWSKRRRDANG